MLFCYRYTSLAFKHEISLQSEIAEAIRTVLQTLQSTVEAEEQTHRSGAELHALREAEVKARHRDGEDAKEEALVPPPEPLVRKRQLPEILNMLLELSHQPDIHTQAHAALLRDRKKQGPGDGLAYLTPEQKQKEERRVWHEILRQEPLRGEGWEEVHEDTDGDEEALDPFDSDNWSSEDDEPRTPKSARSSASRRRSSRSRADLEGAQAGDEALAQWDLLQPADSSTWEQMVQGQVNAFKSFREESALSRAESAELDSVGAVRQLLSLMQSDDEDVETTSPAVQHATTAASRHAFTHAQSIQACARHVRIVSEGLAQKPSKLLQAFAEACLQVLARWQMWLAEKDAQVASFATRPERWTGEPITVASILGQSLKRARSLQALDDVITSESQRPAFHAVRILNKLHALLAAQAEVSKDTDSVMLRDLDSCFSAIAGPICQAMRHWTTYGAPFDGAPSERIPTREIFIRETSVSLLQTKHWADMYRLDADEDGSELIPAFAAPYIDDILQAGMSVGLLRAFGNIDRRLAETTASLPHSASTIDESGTASESAVQRAQTSLRALVPEARLAQKRAHDYLVLPSWDGGCDLYRHLASLQDFFLLRRGGEMHAWSEEIFGKVSTSSGASRLTNFLKILTWNSPYRWTSASSLTPKC